MYFPSMAAYSKLAHLICSLGMEPDRVNELMENLRHVNQDCSESRALFHLMEALLRAIIQVRSDLDA